MWDRLDNLAKRCNTVLIFGATVSLIIGVFSYIGSKREEHAIHVIYDTEYCYSKRDDIRKELDKMFDGYKASMVTFIREMGASENTPTNEVEKLVDEVQRQYTKHERVFRHYWNGIMDFLYDNAYEKKFIHVKNLAAKPIDELRVCVSGYYNLRDVELSSASPRSEIQWFRKEMTQDKNNRRIIIPYRKIAVGDTVTFTVLADTVATAEVVVQAFSGGKEMNVDQMTYAQYLEKRKESIKWISNAFGAFGIFLVLSFLIRIHTRLRKLEGTHR